MIAFRSVGNERQWTDAKHLVYIDVASPVVCYAGVGYSPEEWRIADDKLEGELAEIEGELRALRKRQRDAVKRAASRRSCKPFVGGM